MVKSKEQQELERQAKNDQHWFVLGKLSQKDVPNWHHIILYGIVFLVLGIAIGFYLK